MTTFEHHLRFSLALALEFEEEGRAESRTVFIADRVFSLADWLAAWLTAILLLFNRLPSLRSWWSDYRRCCVLFLSKDGWAADWSLIVEAARLLLIGRWLFLESPLWA